MNTASASTNKDHSSTQKLVEIKSVPVLEHQVFFILPFVYDANSNVDFSARESMNRFSQDIESLEIDMLIDGLGQPFFSGCAPLKGSPKCWIKKANQALTDLQPVFKQVIGAVDTDSRPEHHNCKAYTFNPSKFLGVQNNPGEPRYYTVPLKSGELWANICDPSLYIFLSGVGLLVIPIRYEQPQMMHAEADDLLNGNYLLTHPNVRHENRAAIQASASKLTALTAIRMADLARALLPKYVSKEIRASRYFVYSALRVAPESFAAVGDDRLLAHRLANRQNANYQPVPEHIGTHLIQNSTQIMHVAALEGGCTLIIAGESSKQFYKGFIGNQCANTYLPLLISELHCHYWLLSQTDSLSSPRMSDSIGNERLRLERLSQRLLNFRRYFSYPLPSKLTPHNEYHELWQRALNIDKLSNFLTNTANEATEVLRYEHLKIIRYASAGVTGLVVTQQLMTVIRDKQLDNIYLWQRRLYADRVDAIEATKTGTSYPILEKIDAEIASTVELANKWEDYYFFGSLFGLVLGIMAARFMRLKP